jgi:glycosyltransferase involved in cell wall biosynthesis
MKTKKKIIILTYYSFPCHESVLENVFAKELAREHEVTWLFDGDVSKGRTLKWHNSQVLLIKLVKGNHWRSKLANNVLKWQKVFKLLKLLWQDDIQIVLIRDLPLEALLITPFRLFFGFRLYFQYTAPLGDISIGYFRGNKTIKRFWYLFIGCFHNLVINRVLKTADLVFPITYFHKKKLLSHTREERLIPITMGVDEEWLNRVRQKIPHLEKLKEKHFLITYFGTLIFTRNPRFILKAFAEVKNKCPNCKLILIGKAAFLWEEKELQSICRNLGIEQDVIFTGYLDRNDLQDYLRYCDISISAIPAESYYRISSPTKLYESLGNSLPVVANREILEQEKVILESGGGILVDYETTSFCDAIVRLLNDKNLREEIGRKGREYVIKNYSYRVIAKNISPCFL